ncbi:MAG: FIST N-terminal domain-containing protein, partial [Polyangiales bacterium]
MKTSGIHDPASSLQLRAATLATCATQAARELAGQLPHAPAVVFVFASSSYDFDKLGPALTQAFPESCVVGCSTAGQIGAQGFQPGGIVACALQGDVHATAHIIEPLDAMADPVAQTLEAVHAELSAKRTDDKAFGFLLVDGLSLREASGSAFERLRG